MVTATSQKRTTSTRQLQVECCSSFVSCTWCERTSGLSFTDWRVHRPPKRCSLMSAQADKCLHI
ncbi:hypothetical protein RRG08_018129, partial [Elysia crispata]